MRIPPIGPRRAEYPTSHVKIYPLGSATSFQGWIRIPMIPVMSPPVRKPILEGQRLEKSFAGLTTFAARLVARGGRERAKGEIASTRGLVNLVMRTTGSQMGLPP